MAESTGPTTVFPKIRFVFRRPMSTPGSRFSMAHRSMNTNLEHDLEMKPLLTVTTPRSSEALHREPVSAFGTKDFEFCSR